MSISDWSSDVGSSDRLLATSWNEDREPLEQLKDFGGSLLGHRRNVDGEYVYYLYRVIGGYGPAQLYMGVYAPASEVDSTAFDRLMLRSEERRVGKECVSTC